MSQKIILILVLVLAVGALIAAVAIKDPNIFIVSMSVIAVVVITYCGWRIGRDDL